MKSPLAPSNLIRGGGGRGERRPGEIGEGIEWARLLLHLAIYYAKVSPPEGT